MNSSGSQGSLVEAHTTDVLVYNSTGTSYIMLCRCHHHACHSYITSSSLVHCAPESNYQIILSVSSEFALY